MQGNTIGSFATGIHAASSSPLIVGNTVDGASVDGIDLIGDTGVASVSGNTITGLRLGRHPRRHAGGLDHGNAIRDNGSAGISFVGPSTFWSAKGNAIVRQRHGGCGRRRRIGEPRAQLVGMQRGPGTHRAATASRSPTAAWPTPTPWLVMGLTASPATVARSAATTATTDFLHDSDAADASTDGALLPPLDVLLATTLGSPASQPLTTSAGTVSVPITAPAGTDGIAHLSATTDNETPAGRRRHGRPAARVPR